MHLRADLTESIAIETLRKIVIFAARMNKRRCVIRATPTDFIILNDTTTSRHYWVEVKIQQHELFGDYSIDGLTPETNEIFMELSASDLSQALSGVESMIKMRLTREGGVPHLSIKTETVNNSIPTTLLTVRQWDEYERGIPEENLLLGIYMPPLKMLNKVITSMKNTGATHVTIAANFNGELEISTRTDTARISICVDELKATKGAQAQSQAELTPDGFVVKTVLDCAHLHSFISHIPSIYSYLLMQIDTLGNAYFSTSQIDSTLTVAFPGHNRL